MPRHVELRCVACDTLVGRVPAVRVAIGSPFQECPECGALVARGPVNEWDFLAAGARARYGLERAARVVGLSLLPGLVYLAATRIGGRPIEAWSLGATLVLGILLATPLAAHGVQSVRRSRRRLMDPMYRAKLMAFERANLARSRAAAP